MREKEFLPAIEEKLGISQLNDMQLKMMSSAHETRDIILLAPTGSGKTLAFTLPAFKLLKPPCGRLQMLVITPSRELTLQVAHIIREISGKYKVVALYGGHSVEDEKNSLSVVPDIIVATPGRLLDHLQRRNTDIINCSIVVLDEFDKALELGFENEMKKIFGRLKNLKRIMLTSATKADILPGFLNLNNPMTIDFLVDNKELHTRQRHHRVDSDSRDKLESLLALVKSLQKEKSQKIIVFVNHRESAERVDGFLKKKNVDCVLYHGALDQREREIALAKFNNGSCRVLVATDLAARGLDIENVGSIVHYHQAVSAEAHTHRNGRTARAGNAGDIYVLIGAGEDIRPFVEFDDTYYPDASEEDKSESGKATLYISEGRKEKLSRGDILGFLAKECGVPGGEIGRIDVFDHYILVAVGSKYAREVVAYFREHKIKGRKVRCSIA